VGGRFDGRVAVVTGGAGGIGDQIVRRFIAEGGRAVVPDVIDPADPVEGARYVRCDITDRAQVEAAFASIEANEGRLDVLVNNAGTQQIGLTETFDAADWSRLLDIHVVGTFNCSALAMSLMRPKRSGSIVSIASVAGIIALPGRGPYSAAKAALMSLTRVMAVEMAEVGIRVNAVAPGPIWTPLNPCGGASPEKLEKFGEDTPMGRPGQPNEVAPAFLFLACEDSSYMSGQVLHPNGGTIVNG